MTVLATAANRLDAGLRITDLPPVDAVEMVKRARTLPVGDPSL